MTAWARLRREQVACDRGTTLAEVLVGMGVMVIFMTMFTSVVFSLNNTTTHLESVADSTDSVNAAFLQLDRTIRYAAAISRPSATPDVNGNYWAEFQTTNTGTTQCTQLRFNATSQTLSTRTWNVLSASTYSTPTSFTVMASRVSPAATPFVLVPNPTTPSNPGNLEQLTISLNSTRGTGAGASTAGSSMTFTAVNSSVAYQAAVATSTQPNTICTGPGRP